MNYVIIENDSLSLRRIKAMCERLRPEWHLAFTASTVEEACRLFELNPDIGLALCDIELDDGLSLSIFRKIPAEFSRNIHHGFRRVYARRLQAQQHRLSAEAA